ncbi:hypothetical protein AC51_4948 [Escherichia coli 5-172-05_S3_C3]|nr:hypothetical protein AC51_4948 [Escherichia coli 5-172-05_S3_C3]
MQYRWASPAHVQKKSLEVEKEILKQAAVLMSEIPGKLSR